MDLGLLIYKSIPVAIGGVLGFIYYKFVGCSTGACPITSNPITSILYGMILGLAFSAGR